MGPILLILMVINFDGFRKSSIIDRAFIIAAFIIGFTFYTLLESPLKVLLKKYSNFFTKTNFHGKKSKKRFLKISKFPNNRYSGVSVYFP